MTKKLEDLLELSNIEDEPENSEPEEKSIPELVEESKEIISALSNAERIDLALKDISGFKEHDKEMDDIAEKALQSFEELRRVGLGVHDMYMGKVYEVANSMLETAMNAKDAKIQKKLKMLDLQIKKLKIDRTTMGDDGSGNGAEFDRNELLKHIISVRDEKE